MHASPATARHACSPACGSALCHATGTEANANSHTGANACARSASQR